jgi:Flp pilus assembly pilin Flp
MNDLLLRAYVNLAVTARVLRDRLRNEIGQTTTEYVGILVIVGAIILALVGAGIPARVGTAATNALNQIFGGAAAGGGTSPGPQPT